ncbi:MAG TPA: SAM-dependent chlorinase/fluorinase [Acidimicrobiales bacterium]|nr:SAM-dependent chlorinase/fluorinase [Acidimicrobiales bacterium]
MPPECLTLLTDYGLDAGFVGILHAVALRIAPALPVIDLDHSVPRHDVRLGALRLERSMRYVPVGVHVAVVDPGVGGDRRAVAVEAGGRLFVGPDNGLLTWAVEACGGAERCVALGVERYWLPARTGTFDGRDVFVPVAAHLGLGTDLAELGDALDPATLVGLTRPLERPLGDGSVELEVLQVDGFGNVQLSGDATTVARLGLRRGDPVELLAGARSVGASFGATFGDVGAGEAVLLLDSDTALALSVNRGRADLVLGSGPGATVVLRAVPELH